MDGLKFKKIILLKHPHCFIFVDFVSFVYVMDNNDRKKHRTYLYCF